MAASDGAMDTAAQDRVTADVAELARALESRGLAAAALLLLDAHRPFRPLAGHAASFLSPLLRPLIGDRFRLAADLLRSDHDIDRLMAALGKGGAEGDDDA